MKRKRGDAYPRLFDDDDGAVVEIRRERAKVLEKQVGLLAGASAGPSTEQDHRGFGGRSVSQQVAEVGVSGDDDALVQTRMVEDGLICGIQRDFVCTWTASWPASIRASANRGERPASIRNLIRRCAAAAHARGPRQRRTAAPE
jgi:hypothetical protein